ncbi:unnamed protein product, partial [marine sediment metagenome]
MALSAVPPIPTPMIVADRFRAYNWKVIENVDG